MRLRSLVAIVAALAFASCTPATEPTHPEEPALQAGGGITPMCQAGCVEVDPFPAAPGYFLGSAAEPAACTEGGQTDTDQDGLSTFCERKLAEMFAPQLYYASNDRIAGEPRWAARSLAGSEVRIAYLLSMYVDDGPVVFCDVFGFDFLFHFDDPCLAHYGDVEMVVLDVRYNPDTQHWVLFRAYYSAHHDVNMYTAGADGYARVHYPERLGGYPRAFVAFSKHALYATDKECDAGGTLKSDTCISDATARVPAPGTSDIGSRAVHTATQDCREGSDPLWATPGVIECYWTVKNFTGWSGMTPDAPPYSYRLADFGF